MTRIVVAVYWEVPFLCHSGKPSNHLQKQVLMSGPSRRPEIRRRRTRREKIVKLRKRLAAASTEVDRGRLTAKIQRLALNSPGQPLLTKL